MKPRRIQSKTRAFSLAEVIVATVVMIVMMLAMLGIFDRSARIARDQSELAVMQQSLRVAHFEMVRFARMAGAGGLPLTWNNPTQAAYGETGAFPNGFAVAIANNVATGTEIPPVGGDFVIPGMDVLTVRGVFTTPVYYFQNQRQAIGESGDWVNAAGQVDIQTVEIPDMFGVDLYGQSLQPLIERLTPAVAAGRNLPFILRDLLTPDAYMVLEWVAGSNKNRLVPHPCADASGRQCITIALRLNNDSGDLFQAFGELSLGTMLQPNAGAKTVTLPAGSASTTVAFPKQYGSLGLLEEYVFYLRADYETPNDPTSRLLPVLTRRQLVPNTETGIDRVDLVDGLIDFQIAVGFDRDFQSTSGDHDRVSEFVPGAVSATAPDAASDEILFNAPGDLALANPETALAGAFFSPSKYPNMRTWFHPQLQVHFLRLTTVSQATKPNVNADVPNLGTIEDSDRSVSFNIGAKTYRFNDDTKYRRRALRTIVELRNLR